MDTSSYQSSLYSHLYMAEVLCGRISYEIILKIVIEPGVNIWDKIKISTRGPWALMRSHEFNG